MVTFKACFHAIGCLRMGATGSNAKTLTQFIGLAIILLTLGLLVLAYVRHRQREYVQNVPSIPDDLTKLAIGF